MLNQILTYLETAGGVTGILGVLVACIYSITNAKNKTKALTAIHSQTKKDKQIEAIYNRIDSIENKIINLSSQTAIFALASHIDPNSKKLIAEIDVNGMDNETSEAIKQAFNTWVDETLYDKKEKSKAAIIEEAHEEASNIANGVEDLDNLLNDIGTGI